MEKGEMEMEEMEKAMAWIEMEMEITIVHALLLPLLPPSLSSLGNSSSS